jgi:hypothetical protein
MPFSGSPWGYDEEPLYDEQMWEDDPFGDPASLSIWKPRDPDPWFTPTLPERNAYRAEMQRMATVLSKENLQGQAQAIGPSGFGADYAPAGLEWTQWSNYQPRSRVGLSSWGWEYGLKDPFPILGGAIISPTIDIFTRQREQEYDEQGRPLHNPYQRVSSGLVSGRATVGQIMQRAAERGKAELEKLVAAGMTVGEAGLLAERVARQSVRSQTQSFGRADFGERWSYPYGLRKAMEYSANIRLHGDYGVGPKDLFGELGKHGYFTKATSPSVDLEHPERGAWQAYHLDSLYALGWFRAGDGGFITGSNKPAKRRQLGVQKLAAPMGADSLLRRGRLTGDRLLNTTAVFLDNYPYSEGSGVVDPTLVTGFRDYRPVTIERPMRAGDDWQVRFTTVGQRASAGESIFLGEQYIGGKWEPLEELKGIEGVSQSVFGYRKTRSGYQALIERDFPFESGTAKLMHHGMKALLFQSSEIIEQMQGQVRAAVGAGRLPGGVADPRMVLPMPKDWLQTYRGMFDLLPEETLRSMGVADDVIKSRNWQRIGPGVVDKLHQYAEQHRFTFDERHEAPVSRLGAFTRVGNARDIAYFEKGGEQYARFTATHTGYALPIAAGIRMEYPGKRPKYSPEELMQVGMILPGVARGLMRGNAASRIWGVAAAMTEGVVPAGAISHEMLPWVSARLGIDGSFDDEGTARTLVSNLARELKTQQMGRSAIIAPDGSLLPAPADVLSNSIKSLSGQEQSQFVSSYVQALKLMGTGQDATEALAAFQEKMQGFVAGHNVRRDALGARLKYAAEGTFTSHMAIPDDVVVAGESTLRRLAGISRKDPEAASKLDAFIQQLEGGDSPFYVLGTRRPVSDMFNQLGVPMRVVTERMAQELYGVPIENLGRSYAVSPTVAAIWRGDVDADRALLHAVTRARFDGAGGFVDQISAVGEVSRLWQPGSVSFRTPKQARELAGRESLMVRQLGALRAHAPDAYQDYVGKLGGEGMLNLATGLRGDTSPEALLALSEALHGIDVDWNESRKWSDELKVNPGKNLPQAFAWYADPTKDRKEKTVFTREEMLGKFQADAKSKMLMGRGYNRYIRGLTSMAGSPEELQAAVTFAANVYQKALDGQEMTRGELMLFNMMESIGASGAMFDKFYKEEGYISSAFAGGAAGMVGLLADAITTVDAPPSVRALLFSRDPAVQEAVQTGSARQIIQAISGNRGEVPGARAFLEDPARAGILPQMVQALHFSKGSMQDVNLNPAQQAYAAQGQRLRSMIRVLGRGEKEGLPLGLYQKKDAKGQEIAMPGAIGDMRAMAGLSSVGWWRGMAAERMGLPEAFFSSDDEMRKMLREMGVPDFDNPQTVDNDEHMLAIINKSEAELMKYLRTVPKSQWPEIMAHWRSKQQPGGAPSEPGSEPASAGTVPPAAAGDASIAHQVYEEFGGHSAFNAAVESIRTYKANRQQGDPLIPGDRLTRRAVNEIIARGGGEQAMAEWGKIMGQFGVGFRHQMEDSPDGPKPVWSHSYGSLNRGRRGKVFSMPELSEEQYAQFESMVGRALGGVMPDPETFLGNLTNQFMTTVREKSEFDVQSLPSLMPIFQQLMGYGDEMEVWQTMRGTSNMQTRLKLKPQGLKGHARELLADMVQGGLTEGYTPQVMDMMAQGYRHSGIGQGMIRSVRNLVDADFGRMDMKGAWRLWEDAQRVSGALGEDVPDAMLDRMDQLNQTMSRLTEVTEERIQQGRQEIGWREQFLRTPEAQQQMMGINAYLGRVQGRMGAGERLEAEDVRRLGNISELYRRIGTPGAGAMADNIDELLGQQEFRGLAQLAGQGGGGGGIRGVWSRLFGRGGAGGPDGAPAIENMFTELTLGWTAFRARMAWNLATGAQRGWMDDFLRTETSAVGAALAGGVAPGAAGMSSNYLSAQAAMANARAQMGEGATQVYAPLMAGMAGFNASPGMGSFLTMLGTPLGVGSVSAMGIQMVGRGLESPGITRAAGPIGIGLTGLTGLALTSAYVAGEAPEWVRYEDDSYSQRWRARARMSELAAADDPGVVRWASRMAGAIEGALGVEYGAGFGTETEAMRQMAAERAAYRPGTLMHDADKLRGWIADTYENRVPVDSALQLMGSLFQITGRTAQDVYAAPNLHVGPGANFKALMDRYVQYMEGGASPSELFSSQVSAAGAAGVPLGPQTEAWMVQFANLVPGQQRQMYEQAFQSLSPLASATMRPTTFDQATQAVALAQSTGSMQRAASMVMGQQGVGWFTGTFGLEQEGAEARSLGRMFTAMPVAQQETIQRYGGTLGSSMGRMGLSSRESALFSMALGIGYPNDVTRVSNLVVQAESVSLEAGKDGAGFRELVAQALGAGMEGRSAAEQRWFLAAQSGVAGIAPQAFMPASAQAQQFEAAFSLSGQDRIRYTQAAGILNDVYPEGYSQQQLVDVGTMLQRMTIPQALLSTRAGAGMLGVGASMGLGLGSAGAQLIDTLFAGGAGSIPGISGKEVRALSGVLSPGMFQYMNATQMAGLVPGIKGAFGSYYNDPAGLSLYQFNQAMEAATGSTPWGYSAQLGFGPGSLTDSLGRPYGQYEAWTATAGRQAGTRFAPFFDMQMSASYAGLGYASAANAAQSRQFERQLAMSRLNWGSGPFQPLEAVQGAMFPDGGSAAAEPGSGMQVGGSAIGFAQQESAIRRQMWQESLAQQRQSIEFSRQGLELARQGLEISRQELALSRQQYAVQREYKLGEQQAQRSMQLRQYEWSAEDYAIKVERTGITQAWAMEDLQRARRYATGRQRAEIERQIERTQITQGWEQDDQGRSRDRELEVQRYQDQRYEAAVSFEQKLHALQMQRFDLQEQRLNLQSSQLALQEAQLAAQEARLNANAVLQEKLNQLEDERFKAQYEQAQAQMVDDEKLEKLRKAARDAELAYQAAQLANAETIRDAEQKFADSLKGIKEGGVLDKWIEFFNAVRAGPPAPPTPPTEGANGGVITPPDPTGPKSAQPVWHTQPAVNEVGIGRELTPVNAQPVVVNFVLDGEVIMSAVVKPERLRPVVQEIQRRDSWR